MTQSRKRTVVIVGAGAVGSALAWGFSRRSDLAVTAVGRREHMARIRQKGLRVTGIVNETAHFEAAETVPASLADSLAIVSVKARDLAACLESLRPSLGEGSVLLLVQNGYGIRKIAAETLGSSIPARQILTGIVGMGVTMAEPGHIRFWGGNIRLEDGFRSTPYADVFDGTPVKAGISADIRRDMWRKLVVNSVVNPLSVLLRASNRFIAEARLDELKAALLFEGLAVAAAAGYSLSMDTAFFNSFIENDNYTSMYQDIDRGRLTEVDFINGGIVRAAEELGVPVPLNRWICSLIHAVEIAGREGRMRPFSGPAQR